MVGSVEEMSCEEMLKLRFVEDGMRMNGKGWQVKYRVASDRGYLTVT